MNKITQLVTTSRIMVGSFFALAFVMGAVIIAPQAHAETQNITVSENLTVGMAGASVVTLQALLSEMGYLNVPAGIPLGYYGSLTKNAVARYQSTLNVTPAVGYYGPVTKVALFNDFSNHGWTRLLGWTY
ncbi:MAG: peptidoglycan-binding protein [Candidatus Pacebacteria bacterium]|nr:peptidoglycan-binding protein [Candidatus Paceibacterota bacterium]